MEILNEETYNENILTDLIDSESLVQSISTEQTESKVSTEYKSVCSTSDSAQINSSYFYQIDTSGERAIFRNKRYAIQITKETLVELNGSLSINNAVDGNVGSELYLEESSAEQVDDNQLQCRSIPDQMLVRIKSLQFDSDQIKPRVKKSIRLVTQYASHHTKPDTSLENQIRNLFLFPFNYHSLIFDTLKLDFYAYESLLNTKKRLGRIIIRLNALQQAVLNRTEFEGTFPIENNETLRPFEVGTAQIIIKFHFPKELPLTSAYRLSVIQRRSLSVVSRGINRIEGIHEKDERFNLLAFSEANSLSLFDFMLSKKNMNAMKEFVTMCQGFYGHGWRMTKLEFMKAYILLEKYYDQKQNNSPVTGILSEDLDKLIKAKYYLKFSIASYGSFMFNVFGYGYSMAPKNAIRMKSDRKTVQDYFGINKNDVICWEFGKMTATVPNYMVIRDPKSNSIIISIRGTLNAADVITDVLAYYVPWRNGFVHQGMLRSAKYLVKNSLKDIRSAVKKFKVNSIQVIGHSLGASVSSLVTIILRKRCKDLIAKGIDIHAWNFGTPPCCSLDLACKNEIMSYIDNFVNENDIVPRLSYGSLIDFRELTPSKDKRSMLMASIDEFYNHLKSNSREQKLYIPGTIHYLYKKRNPSNPILREVLCEKSTRESFEDVTLRKNFLLQHLPVTKLMEQLFDYDNVSDYLPGYDEINAEENDTDDHNININEVVLKVGNSFNNWDAVQVMVDSFAKQNGFVTNKCHKDLDPVDKSIIHRCTYNCWKAGVHQPKKVEDIDLHHDRSSSKSNCKWEVSFYLRKHTKSIWLTKFENKHNHNCDLATIELASKNLCLSQKILDKIEHYTTHGRLGAGQQYNLIVKEFLQYSIKKKNLYNAIHKFRGIRIHNKSDASTMLSYLLSQLNKDSDYLVIPRLEGPSNELTGSNNLQPKVLFTDGDPAMIAVVHVSYPQTRHMLYIYHLLENVKKKLRAKLWGEAIKHFVEDFCNMRNSYSQEQFEARYYDILTKYESCYSYLEKLYNSHTSWAKYSVVKVFTAGMKSTQHVESIIGIIKKHIDHGTLLKELVNVIEQELEKEAQYTRIKDYYGSNPSIAELIIDILYDAIKELWEVSYIGFASKPNYVVIFNDSTLLYTYMNIISQEMLCWHQYRVLIHSDYATFHISLLHTCWFESFSSDITNFVTVFREIQSATSVPLHYMNQVRTCDVYTPVIRSHINKKVQFGTMISVAKTSIQIAVSESITEELTGLLV
ncbi:13676_t:CDS:10 [Cetraspora pellucida]|uniref:13676_t:CDS:1 n=1 Tax=Cetraspora pellucida TaxID=1433469 RepID=A0A9N9B259_9GLOM|nr:13676_t:CDS:10 [Cetraspora pellucida]